MTYKERFLSAILENPDDESPRLVYADWLEKRGDPRGEFIRIQCALAKLSSTDPRWVDLAKRERELLNTYESLWAAPLAGLVEGWRFRRGFVEEVNLSARSFIAGAESIFRTAPIQGVRLGNLFELSPHWEGPPRSGYWRDDEEFRRVEAQFQHVLCEGMQMIAACPWLARIKRLDLSGDRITDAVVQELSQSPYLSQLVELDLAPNEMGAAGFISLAYSPHLPSLSRLYCDSRIGAENLAEFSSSPLAARLTVFDLADDEEVMSGYPQLARLCGNFMEHKMGDAGVEALISSSRLAGLTSLDLSYNGITAKGAQALAACPQLSNLRRLDMEYNFIGPEGADALANSPYLSNLTKLDLCVDNAVGRKGAQAILNSPYLRELRDLWLDLKYLTNGALYLDHNEYSDEVIEALKRRLGGRLHFFT